MNPIKTKGQIRAELEEQVAMFLKQGGGIKDVPRGISGRADNQNLNVFTYVGDGQTRQTRTPLAHVVKALEHRKTLLKKMPEASPGPKRKLIKDDFGEPLRWVWVEQ